jgi:hypothetical protein
VNIEKIYARLKGFPRPRSAKTITAHQEALAQLYQVLSAFDDMVLHEVNERFLDLYTKKSLPAPVELERLCHQIKREREIRVNATAWQQRQVRKEEQERFNTRYAQQVCHVHGAQAVSEGWQAPYWAFLARNERQPDAKEIQAMRQDHGDRLERWRKGGKIGERAIIAQREKDASLAETINDQITKQKETTS